MMTILQNLINALRDELQHYGEMLALLDQQQDAEQLRGTDEILSSLAAVNTQGAKLQVVRQSRERAQQQLALALHQTEDASFTLLIPLLPEQYRPLISALVQENNELLLRVHQRARQNQLLLRRSIDTMQRFISTLEPHPAAGDSEAVSTELVTGSPGPPLREAFA